MDDFLKAAAEGDLDRLKALLAAGADINMANEKHTTALHFAAWNGKSETAVFLIENGSDVRAGEGDGWTPLHDAIRKENSDMVLDLLHAAFGLDDVKNCKKQLYMKSNNRDEHYLELLRFALRFDFRLDALDISGSCLLEDATKRKYPTSVEFIRTSLR